MTYLKTSPRTSTFLLLRTFHPSVKVNRQKNSLWVLDPPIQHLYTFNQWPRKESGTTPRSLHEWRPAVVISAVHRSPLSEQEPDQILMSTGSWELKGRVPFLVCAVNGNKGDSPGGIDTALGPRIQTQASALRSRLVRPGLKNPLGALIVAFIASTKQQSVCWDSEIHLWKICLQQRPNVKSFPKLFPMFNGVSWLKDIAFAFKGVKTCWN